VTGNLITEYARPVVGVAEVRKRDLSACTHLGTLQRIFLNVDGLREATTGAGGGSFVNDPRFVRAAEYCGALFVLRPQGLVALTVREGGRCGCRGVCELRGGLVAEVWVGACRSWVGEMRTHSLPALLRDG
jgi:hypothetical protein